MAERLVAKGKELSFFHKDFQNNRGQVINNFEVIKVADPNSRLVGLSADSGHVCTNLGTFGWTHTAREDLCS